MRLAGRKPDGLQAAYDGIMTGEKGYSSLAVMVLLTVYHKTMGLFAMGRGASKSKPTRLINAVGVGDNGDMKPRDGTSVVL